MNYQIILKYPAVFMAAFLTTLVLTPLVRRFAVARGLVDMPDSRRIHAVPMPRLGGLAVFAGIHVACAVIFLLPWREFMGHLDTLWWTRFLVLSGLVTAVGVVDDIRGMRAWVKLSGQIVAAVLAFVFDMRFGVLLGIRLPFALDLIITVLWILVVTNAFNLIDGMDGLASGLALIAALGMAGGLLLQRMPADVLVLLGIAGACAAFLRYNFNPASIFLGDSGSMLLGFSLAVIAMSTGSKGTAMASIGVPLLAVGVPLFDTVLAVWRRFVRGLSSGAGRAGIMSADTEHLHHRLTRFGFSQRRVATLLYLLGVVLVGVALLGLVYRAFALGIYLVAFVAGVYVVVKHLARVELWDSGSALLVGLRRPPGRVAAVMLYPVCDVLIMALALAAAQWMSLPEYGLQELREIWLQSLPVWVGVPFLSLFVARAYLKVWSRARLCELAGLWLALIGGTIVVLGLAVMREGNEFDKALFTQALLYFMLISSAVIGIRILSRLLKDALTLGSRHPSLASNGAVENVLIYGAGARAILFLRRRTEQFSGRGDGRRIIGFVDDDTNLHGRMVYGYKVRGNGQMLDELVDRYDVKEVIVATNLNQDVRQRLQDAAARKSLKLTEWLMEEKAFGK